MESIQMSICLFVITSVILLEPFNNLLNNSITTGEQLGTRTNDQKKDLSQRAVMFLVVHMCKHIGRYCAHSAKASLLERLSQEKTQLALFSSEYFNTFYILLIVLQVFAVSIQI